MKFKRFDKKYVVRFERGEELVESLKKFCENNDITLASIIGLGATNKIVLGLFKSKEKEYLSKEYTGDYEISSLLGNISEKEGEVYLHIHANISNENGEVFGGHLSSAVISATFEAVIEKIEGQVERYFDEEIGLNLWKL